MTAKRPVQCQTVEQQINVTGVVTASASIRLTMRYPPTTQTAPTLVLGHISGSAPPEPPSSHQIGRNATDKLGTGFARRYFVRARSQRKLITAMARSSSRCHQQNNADTAITSSSLPAIIIGQQRRLAVGSVENGDRGRSFARNAEHDIHRYHRDNQPQAVLPNVSWKARCCPGTAW